VLFAATREAPGRPSPFATKQFAAVRAAVAQTAGGRAALHAARWKREIAALEAGTSPMASTIGLYFRIIDMIASVSQRRRHRGASLQGRSLAIWRKA